METIESYRVYCLSFAQTCNGNFKTRDRFYLFFFSYENHSRGEHQLKSGGARCVEVACVCACECGGGVLLSSLAVYPNLLTLSRGRDRVRVLRESQKTGDRGGGEELKDKLWD